MRKIVFLAGFLCLFAFVQTTANGARAQSHTEKIEVVVNQDAISNSDIDARMKLIMISSGMPQNDEIKEKLRPQIVKLLVEEQIKIQEASRLGIQVTEEEIESGLGALAAQNNVAKNKFLEMVRGEGIPIWTLKDQIRSQLAWNDVVQQRIRPKIEVTETDIESMEKRLMSNTGKSEYLLSEIFLPVEAIQDEKDVKQLATKLTHQLATGSVPFERLATQFSQSAAAARGGDLGWVQEDSVQEQVGEKVSRMAEGDFSTPVRSLSGYHIMFLRKKRTITEANLPSRNDIGTQLGMEQLERLQRRYLMDLKASAFIEYRV